MILNIRTKRLSLLLALLTPLLVFSTSAAPRKKVVSKDLVAYADSLQQLKARLDSVQNQKDSLWYEQPMQGRYFQLFVPSTFFHNVARQRMGYAESSDEDEQVSEALWQLYLKHPEYIRITETQLRDRETVDDGIATAPAISKETREISRDQGSAVEDFTVDTPVQMVVQKPKMWAHSADFYMQLMQNYFSSNWYKGGESNYAVVGRVTLQANYNNLWGLKWDNKLEMKLGMQSNRSDTVHQFKSSEDLLRLTSKIGKQAHKRWYYMVQFIGSTQFAHGYKSNDVKIYSDFLAPLDISLSVGMDYNMTSKDNKIKGTINMSPFAAYYKYVCYERLAPNFGIDEGKYHKLDFGSQLTLDAEFLLMKDFKWKTRLYAYTSYKRALIEWENTLSFQFNKYIACNIFVYPRFDDSVKRDEEYGYFQLKEYASLGFSLAL